MSGWTSADEARLLRFASIGAEMVRLNKGTGGSLGFEAVTASMPADALALYHATNARWAAEWAGRDTGRIENACRIENAGRSENADIREQLLRVRHRARFGTETAR